MFRIPSSCPSFRGFLIGLSSEQWSNELVRLPSSCFSEPVLWTATDVEHEPVLWTAAGVEQLKFLCCWLACHHLMVNYSNSKFEKFTKCGQVGDDFSINFVVFLHASDRSHMASTGCFN